MLNRVCPVGDLSQKLLNPVTRIVATMALLRYNCRVSWFEDINLTYFGERSRRVGETYPEWPVRLEA